MNKKLLINLIKSNVDEINKIAENLDENTVIPSVFYELSLSKIRNLYVQFKLLREIPENDLTFKEFASDIVHILDNEPTIKIETQSTPKEQIVKPISDYEKIVKLREQDFLSVQINFNPIKSIAEAIDLNDKIWFTKTLFNGNLNHFNETVQKLNNFEYLEQAVDYVDNQFNWDYQNNTVRKFFQYVYMRYA